MSQFPYSGDFVTISNNFRKGWDGPVKGSGISLMEDSVYVYNITV